MSDCNLYLLCNNSDKFPNIVVFKLVSMGSSLFHKLLFDDSDEDEIMRRVLKASKSQRKHRRYIEHNRLAGHKRLYLDYFADKPITAALRMLAYRVTADFMDEYMRIGETTAIETLKKFVKAVVDIFSKEYLRAPNNEDIARLLANGERHGFPGMLGSIDCMHWKWKNCPTAWKERSPIFSELEQGHAPAINYSINVHEYTMGYYLADGIYPKWSTFVKTIPSPRGHKQKLFAKAQEANRKDVERAFGVLQARFAIVRGPAKFFYSETLQDIMKAYVILHNMIIEDERDVNEALVR
ncbi:uncharacterized protein LOC142625116 [Castanea sativa]|uniref:uncharacterized protein LOC142625116 n=1 Tax=Castanea sativa TaxID=21020 RepID=UPI003F6509FF